MVGSMPQQRFAVRLSVADEGVVKVEAERQPGGQDVAGGGAQECAVVRRVRAAVQVAHEQGGRGRRYKAVVTEFEALSFFCKYICLIMDIPCQVLVPMIISLLFFVIRSE